MKKQDEPSSEGKKPPPKEELKHFKSVVKSLMNDASKVLAEIELLYQGTEIEEQISLLNHYLDYTRRLCESNDDDVVHVLITEGLM